MVAEIVQRPHILFVQFPPMVIELEKPSLPPVFLLSSHTTSHTPSHTHNALTQMWE